MGYSAQLNSRRHTFIAEEKFHHVEKKSEAVSRDAATRNTSPAKKEKRAESVKRREDLAESEKKRRREEDLKKEDERKSAEKKIKPDTPGAAKTKANGVRDRDSETDESRS